MKLNYQLIVRCWCTVIFSFCGFIALESSAKESSLAPAPSPLEVASKNLPPLNNPVNLDKLPPIADIKLLEINDELKALLDREVRPFKSQKQRTEELHDFLFSPYRQNIRYDFNITKTAQGTFDSKSGNCLSHAALYVAAARYLGLKARFQNVKVPQTWEKADDFYIVPGHINVRVYLSDGRLATVEFVATYMKLDPRRSKVMNDRKVLAEYYNNKGVEAMGAKDYALAIAYFQKSTSTHSRFSLTWSNLGVAFKLVGERERAEKAYIKALKINPHNLSTMTNLYSLYSLQGETDKAEKYLKKVSRYSRKNPYKLHQLAEVDIANDNFDSAQKILQKAIKIKKNESLFHHSLAKVYFHQGKRDAALQQIQMARDVAKEDNEINRYQHKLDMIARLYAQPGASLSE